MSPLYFLLNNDIPKSILQSSSMHKHPPTPNLIELFLIPQDNNWLGTSFLKTQTTLQKPIFLVINSILFHVQGIMFA